VSFPDAGTFPFYCEFHGVTLMMYGAVFVAP
jgi:plastocyanin